MRGKKIRHYIRNQKGSYTVEAALLMGIILSVLVSVIYMGFWYHDKSFLQSAAYELACAASLHGEDNSWQIESAADTLIRGRMLGTRGLQNQCQNGKKTVTVSFQGNFSIPGMILPFFQNGKMDIKETCTMTTEQPSKRIQKIRGLAKVAKKIGGIAE